MPINNARQYHTYQTTTLRRAIAFNSAGAAAGIILQQALPAGAIITNLTVQVVTPFNAGTTNAINVGTTAGGAQVLTDAATAGTRKPAVPALVFAADTDLFIQFAQTGAVATAGLANIVIEFVPANDA